MKKHIAALALLALLTACADAPQPPPAQDFVLPPKINLDVQLLSLTDRSGPQPASSPYTSNDFHPTISQALRQWAKDRLQAVGSYGQAMVIIKDASLTQQAIPYETDWFTRQQASKYIAHASVDIEAKGREGYAIASAEASRYVTLPENPTAEERRKAYFDVLNGLMRDLGVNLESSIQAHMHDFIVSVPMFDNSSGGTLPPVAVTPPSGAPAPSLAPVMGDSISHADSYPAQSATMPMQ